MALFSIKSQSKEKALHAPEADFRAARKVGPYRVGQEAVYFPAFPGWRGLPYWAVARAWSKPASFNVTGCCGKALPMLRLRMFYDGAFYQDFLFERPAQADAVLDALAAARPEIPIERAERVASIL